MKNLKTFEAYGAWFNQKRETSGRLTKEEFHSFEEFENYVEANKDKFNQTFWCIMPDYNDAERFFNMYLDNSFIIIFNDDKVCCGCFTDENGDPKKGSCFDHIDKPLSVEEFKELLDRAV
jgi:hypothetical protein